MQIDDVTIKYLEGYFDKILVISVPRYTERHKLVAERLRGLNFDFFWGADKQELIPEQPGVKDIYDKKRAVELHRFSKGLTAGEIACSLSHRRLYEEIVRKKWNKVLILEDDVYPLYENLVYLPNALNELPEEWELVYLGYLKNEVITASLKRKRFFYKIQATLRFMKWSIAMVNKYLPKPYSRFLMRAGFHDCTHAYAITQSAAKKLLAIQTPIVFRADDLLSDTNMKGQLNAFITTPKFFDQEEFHDPTSFSRVKE